MHVVLYDDCFRYFLEQGYTTWPEDWNAKPGVSKMHGCYNSIGLWFVQGVAGISVDASDELLPLTIRAGVDAGDITWAKGSRFAIGGEARSEWSLGPNGLEHNVVIPGNVAARVMIPADDVDDVKEGGHPAASAEGVTLQGAEQINRIHYIVFHVASGVYVFTSPYQRRQL